MSSVERGLTTVAFPTKDEDAWPAHHSGERRARKQSNEVFITLRESKWQLLRKARRYRLDAEPGGALGFSCVTPKLALGKGWNRTARVSRPHTSSSLPYHASSLFDRVERAGPASVIDDMERLMKGEFRTIGE